jgi:hypothetical protein
MGDRLVITPYTESRLKTETDPCSFRDDGLLYNIKLRWWMKSVAYKVSAYSVILSLDTQKSFIKTRIFLWRSSSSILLDQLTVGSNNSRNSVVLQHLKVWTYPEPLKSSVCVCIYIFTFIYLTIILILYSHLYIGPSTCLFPWGVLTWNTTTSVPLWWVPHDNRTGSCLSQQYFGWKTWREEPLGRPRRRWEDNIKWILGK